MVKILREADAAPVTAVAKKHGVSDATDDWRKRYGQPKCLTDNATSGQVAVEFNSNTALGGGTVTQVNTGSELTRKSSSRAGAGTTR